jgi:hypothetical protein
VLTRIPDPDLYRLANKTQAITTSGTSAEMAEGVGAGIDVVMINATEDALIAFGGEVELVEWSEVTGTWAEQTNTWKQYAPVGDGYQEKDWPTYWRIVPGQKISAMQVSSAGTVYVTEMTR